MGNKSLADSELSAEGIQFQERYMDLSKDLGDFGCLACLRFDLPFCTYLGRGGSCGCSEESKCSAGNRVNSPILSMNLVLVEDNTGKAHLLRLSLLFLKPPSLREN